MRNVVKAGLFAAILALAVIRVDAVQLSEHTTVSVEDCGYGVVTGYILYAMDAEEIPTIWFVPYSVTDEAVVRIDECHVALPLSDLAAVTGTADVTLGAEVETTGGRNQSPLEILD